MKEKHTPGPLYAKAINYIRDGERMHHICDAVGRVVCDGYLKPADAKLFASSPDLLAALKDAEFLLRKAAINWKEAAGMVDSFRRSADDARAAIAKAEG